MSNRLRIKQIFNNALKHQYAIPAFNFDNLEMLKAIVEAAEETKSYVFAMSTQSAANYMGIEYVNAIKDIAKQSDYVITHWDHGYDFDLAKNAIINNWQSVMHDCSSLDFDNNCSRTKQIMELAMQHDTWIEAEIGVIGGKEDDNEVDYSSHTTVKEALEFYEKTNCDMLAISVGTAHGLYKGEVKVNLERIKEIHSANKDIILVLHGGTGVPDEIIKEAIKNGIAKVNIGTELKVTYCNAIKHWMKNNPNLYDARKFGRYAIDEVKKMVIKKIKLCGQ